MNKENTKNYQYENYTTKKACWLYVPSDISGTESHNENETKSTEDKSKTDIGRRSIG